MLTGQGGVTTAAPCAFNSTICPSVRPASITPMGQSAAGFNARSDAISSRING